MFDLDKWQEILGTMSKHKLRTALTAFGVIWGILMLVILLGMGKGLEKGTMKNFSHIAKNTMWIWGGKTVLPYNGLKPGRRIVFSNDDYYAMLKEIPDIGYLAPGTSLTGEYTIRYKHTTGTFAVGGDLPALNNIRPMAYPAGRFINEQDVIEKRKVCVVGSRVVELLFDKENPIGKYIEIKGVYFLVVGRFEIENMGGSGRDDSEKIYIPLTTLQSVFNAPNRITSFALTPKDGVDPEQLETRVKQFLAKRHDVSPLDKNAVGGWNSGKETKKLMGLFTGINAFLWFVGIMSIIAGVVGVSNVMLIIVKERTKEIGVRKALGATPFSIVSLIIQESIFITSISGYVGLVLGVLAVEGMGNLMASAPSDKGSYFGAPEVDLSIAISATIILIIAGALAGLFPAVKAAKIHPIEALRDE